MLTRRALLQASPLLLASLSRSSLARASGVRAAISRRYIVQIVLSGGIDPVYFTDPKEPSEVDPDVEIPYPKKSILTIGDARYGPLFAPLAKWAPRTTIVNGVVLGTANHPAGLRQLLRFRNGATDEMPMAIDLIGSRREGEALASVSMGNGIGLAFMSDNFSGPVWKALDASSPEELAMMARVTRSRAQSIADRPTRASLESSARFFERLSSTPVFKVVQPEPPTSATPAKKAEPPSQFSIDLQRTLWLLKNDLARCSVVGAGNWDTHFKNTIGQTKTTEKHFPAIADFLSALETTKNEHGTLFDNTLVVIASEIGRYPILNRTEGKDHFPEAPFIFINAASGGHVFGRTGRRMQALPLPKRPDGKITLTDVGCTLLRIGGVNPETCGYVGEPLDFLGA